MNRALNCVQRINKDTIGKMPNRNHSCSMIIPARNEKGTIEESVLRIPEIGSEAEIIFVEGGSLDGTREEIERVIKLYPGKNIRLIKQDLGSGKADNVRLGFDAARGMCL